MGEIPERAQRDLTPEQEAAVEDLTDKRGISIDMAERAILGERIEPDGPIAAPKSPAKRHPTGHVRDFESDRDYENAAIRAAYQPPSPEQREIAKVGRARVEEALDEAFGKDRHIKAIQERVEREIPIDPDNRAKSLADREHLLNARLRTYFDHKTAS